LDRHCDGLSRLTTTPVVVSAHAPDSCRSCSSRRRSGRIILITRTQFPVASARRRSSANRRKWSRDAAHA